MKGVVITGASSGIGRETALSLDRKGYRVFAGIRRESDGEALVAAATGNLVPVRLEVTDQRSIDEARAVVAADLGEGAPLLGLVNNAGFALTAPMEFIDVDELRRQFEVNVFGVAAVTRAFLPMLSRPGGRVVNMSSGAGKIVTPLLGAYCASKYALEAMSDALRIEVRSQGIHVSVVEPGFIDTPIHGRNEVTAERVFDAMPEEGRRVYGAALEKLNANTGRMARNATPASAVADAVVHALEAAKPKTRYPVALEAHLLAWLGPFMGDSVRDAVFGRIVGL